MEIQIEKPKMITNRFGILLAEKRIKEKRNIPLSEVADKTLIARTSLFSWANNTVTRYDERVIDALCEYFNCGVGDLLEWKRPGPRQVLANEEAQADLDYDAQFESRSTDETTPEGDN